MKHFYLKCLFFSILSLMSITISAYDCKVDGIYYNLDNTNNTASVTYLYYYSISNESAYSGSVTIPSSFAYNGKTYSVTSIGNFSFNNCSGLTSIDIPSSVTSIGNSAFMGCSGLTSVTIPNSVTSIEISAFEDCIGLTSVTIPNSVTSIGNSAFSNCSGLTSILIPSTVISIGQSAFRSCSSLTSVIIPNSVTSIGHSVFSNCIGLTSIVVESGNSVYDSRNNCNAIIETASNTLITGCKNTKIPSSVPSIGYAAFDGCSGLTSIEIPSSVTSIEISAFEDCIGLTSVTIPNSVTSIGGRAFYNCSGLTSVNFNATNCTTMGLSYFPDNAVFIGCTSINTLNIGENVKNIPDCAFSGCSGLTSVTIPNSVTGIGERAFYGCSGLTSVNFNATNCITMGSFSNPVFEGCASINSINIGENVKNIPDCAFSGCSGLTSVTIGNSVTTIGDGAFKNCPRLYIIYSLNPTPPNCSGSSTFSCSSGVRDDYDVYTYATLHVPMGSEELYSSAHEWRYFNKIKEDMESNGIVYYVSLTVKQGTIGYTRQAVKSDTRYTFFIGSLGENKVNTVTFNGVDVTDEVVNGYYTTPEIKGESVLSISFETNSSVKSLSLNNLKVMGYNGEIQIMNIDEPSDVFVYSVDGKLVGKILSAYGSANIQVASEELYVVKVGSRVFKVAL